MARTFEPRLLLARHERGCSRMGKEMYSLPETRKFNSCVFDNKCLILDTKVSSANKNNALISRSMIRKTKQTNEHKERKAK